MALKNMIDLTGKRILLTGAAGGIGAATARACVTLGADVVLADIAPLDDLVGELRAHDAVVTGHQIDVSGRAGTAELVARAGDVDAAIACAGICPLEEDWDDEAGGWDEMFHHVMDVNLLGPLHLAREMLPRMSERGEGRIVLIGSIGGRMGGVSPVVQAHYVASKGGIHAVVPWLAKRAAPHGVLVNGVAPGPVASAMTATTPYDKSSYPLGRIGTPEEIAWPVAFLCSPAASYLSGTILDVNGGLFVG